MNYELIDGTEMHRNHPETFEIPSNAEKKVLQPGMMVKLGFLTGAASGPSAERMWVKIVARTGPRQFTGTLANQPVFIKAKHGDPVDFSTRHILSIEGETIH